MIELLIVASLAVGGLIGYGVSAANDTPTRTTAPLQWGQDGHQKTMMTCRIMCGKHGVKSYETVVGQCECNASISQPPQQWR
jgi:hypothetical protein